jgi:hypothetical protein
MQIYWTTIVIVFERFCCSQELMCNKADSAKGVQQRKER